MCERPFFACYTALFNHRRILEHTTNNVWCVGYSFVDLKFGWLLLKSDRMRFYVNVCHKFMSTASKAHSNCASSKPIKVEKEWTQYAMAIIMRIHGYRICMIGIECSSKLVLFNRQFSCWSFQSKIVISICWIIIIRLQLALCLVIIRWFFIVIFQLKRWHGGYECKHQCSNKIVRSTMWSV